MRMTQYHRSPGSYIIDVLIPVDIIHISTFGVFHKHRCTTHTFKSPDGRVHATGNTLLRAFKQRTGVGVLLNTSFNRHGHPIVGSPDDALLHLVNGWVEGVWIGRWYVEVEK